MFPCIRLRICSRSCIVELVSGAKPCSRLTIHHCSRTSARVQPRYTARRMSNCAVCASRFGETGCIADGEVHHEDVLSSMEAYRRLLEESRHLLAFNRRSADCYVFFTVVVSVRLSKDVQVAYGHGILNCSTHSYTLVAATFLEHGHTDLRKVQECGVFSPHVKSTSSSSSPAKPRYCCTVFDSRNLDFCFSCQ